MSSSTKLLGAAFVMAISSVMVVPAQAVVIKNGVTTLFSDNFESPAPGNLFDNGALPGSWINWDSPPAGVTRGAEVTTPAAFQGVQKGELTTGVGDTFRYISTAPQASGITNATTMLYLPVGADDFTFQILFVTTGGSAAVLSHSGGFLHDITQGVLTPLATTPGQWQKLEIEYDANSTDVTIRANDVSYTYAMTVPSRAGEFQALRFKNTGNLSYYVDAVPEPATAALMGLAGLMTLARRRH